MESAGYSFNSTKAHLFVKILTLVPIVIIFGNLCKKLLIVQNILIIILIFAYYYVFDLITNKKIKPIPRVTICGIFNPDDNTISFGVSRCSTKDVFVKSTGKELSYARAKDTPYKVIKVRGGDKISDRFIDSCLEIEEEVLAMVYPISITK